MGKRKSRVCLILGVLSALMLTGCSSSGDSSGNDGEVLEVSWWINTGEDSSYYLTYEENPVVKYLETLDYGGTKVDLSFVVPITGKELDNFNTLLMTDEYCDIMDMAVSTITPAQLYEDGYIWDLTEYVEQYMPNYTAAMEENPDLNPYLYSEVAGERKILSLSSIIGKPSDASWGYTYRRDWIVKYGANPTTGAAFTCGYTDAADPNTYYDDVVFPSGGTDPVYLSDWEWMFEIFVRAMEDLGIEDGYCYAPAYRGSNESGYLNSCFGGGTSTWSVGEGNQMYFGGSNDSMRAYLQCMSTWYERGWLDKAFAEHTSDQFYAIDMTKVHQGRVGMWIGRASELGAAMDLGDELTDGIMAFGCQLPINDIYGSAEQQGKEPDALYQKSKIRGSCVITKKVTEEELPRLLTFIDFLYTREGGRLIYAGLTKEEFESIQDECYIEYGLTEGAVSEQQNEDGTWTYTRSSHLNQNADYKNFYAGKRLFLSYTRKEIIEQVKNTDDKIFVKATELWDKYPNKAFPDRALRAQFTEEESAIYGKIHANVDTFMATTVPKFITGELDVDDDGDWENYSKMLNKYGPDKITKIYQRVYDSLA